MGHNETISQITKKIICKLKNKENKINYVNTRGDNYNEKKTLDLNKIIRKSMADNKGLYLPKNIPKLQWNEMERLYKDNLSYCELFLRIIELFPLQKTQLNPKILKNMIESAYSTFHNKDILPLTQIDDTKNQWLMEQFHGPTASFKDLALQIYPYLFNNAWNHSNSINDRKTQRVFLVATSGQNFNQTNLFFCFFFILVNLV